MGDTATVEAATRDGTLLRLRLATRDDADALVAGFRHLGEQSRYTRFFSAMPRLSGSILGSLTNVDDHDRVAIIAFDPSQPSDIGSPEGLGVAVARLIRTAPREAELSVTVIDEYHGRGVGRVLMRALVVVARDVEVDRIIAVVMRTNTPMNRLMLGLGAEIGHPEPDDPAVIQWHLDVAPTIAERLDPADVADFDKLVAAADGR